MEVDNLIQSFSEFKDVKNIDRETMMNILEDVFTSVLEKKYDGEGNFNVIINVDKGDLEIWKNREVVEDGKVENEISQISLSDALKIEDDYEVGEELSELVSFDSEFGRRQVLSIRQHLISKIHEQHRDVLIKRYESRIGEIVHGEVYQIWRNEILLTDDEGNDMSLPKSEQIPKDFFKKGESVRAVIKEVNVKNNKANLLDLGTYKMDEILRKQINSGKMNMNLAASALIQYSAKTTMCLNAMMQIQKQFQNEFHKYVEPSITFLVEEIQKQRSHAQNVTNFSLYILYFFHNRTQIHYYLKQN